MPFYRIDLGPNKSGFAHLNFGRKPGPRNCVAPALHFDDPTQFGGKCARAAVALCDATVGTDFNGKPATCDAPMCEQHRTHVGGDVDYCPRHLHLAPGRLPYAD